MALFAPSLLLFVWAGLLYFDYSSRNQSIIFMILLGISFIVEECARYKKNRRRRNGH
jgi:hypothetical protein